MQICLLYSLNMQLRSFWRKYMRKSQYEIRTCVWSKKLDWDMHLVIYPIKKGKKFTITTKT